MRSFVAAGIAALLTLVAIAIALPAVALAHAELVIVEPQAEPALAAPPRQVTLTFNESVAVSPHGVTVFCPDGTRCDRGRSHADGRTATVRVRSSMQGTYAVGWRVTSRDSHTLDGAYTFDVVHPSDGTALARARAESTPARWAGVAATVARGFVLLGVCLALGGAVVHLLLDPAARAHAQLPMGLSLVAVSAPAAALFDAVRANHSSVLDAVRWGVLSRELSGAFGRACMIQTALALATLLVLFVTTSHDDDSSPVSATGRVLTAASCGMLAASLSLSGHAAAATPAWPRQLADSAHALAAATWMGGVVALLWGIRDTANRDTPVRRFSTIAPLCVAVIVSTGAIAAVAEVGWSLHALVSTTYGLLVSTKIVALVAALAIAARSRRLVNGRCDIDSARLRRLLCAETIMLMLVLAASAWLTSSIPARRAAVGGPTHVTRRVSSFGTVRIDVSPGSAGRNSIVVRISPTPGHDPVTPQLRARNTRAAIRNLQIPLTRDGSHIWRTRRAQLPVAGRWTLTVTLRRGTFDAADLDIPITLGPRV